MPPVVMVCVMGQMVVVVYLVKVTTFVAAIEVAKIQMMRRIFACHCNLATIRQIQKEQGIDIVGEDLATCAHIGVSYPQNRPSRPRSNATQFLFK